MCEKGIERARGNLASSPAGAGIDVEFLLGSRNGLPVLDQSFDTLLAFDCMEHVMSPGPVLAEWYRVLRPGGRCLIYWSPYKGPWGPHMDSLIPIPWAHVIFGQRAMFRTAELIYDSPEYVPKHWDIDEQGKKKPNKWRAWSSFKEQDFINELDIPTFLRLTRDVRFRIARMERKSFGGSAARRGIGRALMALPFIGEYFVSYCVIELVRP